MSVHYKFKNNLDHDTVTFDGLSISVADLKKSIMHQKKIGKSSDFDLQITNAQTKEVYDNDEILVPKNTSVIVSRVPIQGGTKNKNSDKPDLPLPIDEDDFGLIRYDRIVKNADLVNANSTEEDKVKAMITQSSQEYDPSKYVKSRSMTGPLPPSYTCFRCGKQGHWIKNCPTNNPDVKRSTGIPRSFMVPVDGPEHKGALLTSSGDYAVPLIDHQAYKEVKKEKPPFVPQDEPVVEPEPQVPEELLCMVCNDLLQDAVLIPCCGNSFCDECVRQVLLESDNHECPICHETQVSPNTLIPNRFLRTAVANYKNEKGKVSSSLVRKAAPPPPPPVPQPASPVSRRVDSPQPSPDSTVESQSNAPDASAAQHDKSPKRTEPKKSETKDTPLAPLQKIKSGNSTPTVCHTPENATPKRSAETDSEDAQPGTPLADEPPTDVINPHHLPIQTIGHEHYSHHHDRYEHSGRYSRSRRDDYGRPYNRSSENQEHSSISTIETITNMRNKCKFSRPAPPRGQFLNQRSHRDDRLDYDHEEYHGRYEKKHERSSRRNHYDRSDRESRYTSRLWCPKIYFNHRCFTGPLLSKGRLAELPQAIGPGPLHLVITEVIYRVVNIAYNSSRVLQLLEIEGEPTPGMEQQVIKAKYKGKTYRATIEVITNSEQVEEFCKNICLKLECCPYLFSPKHVGEACPINCHTQTKTKFNYNFVKKQKKLGRPPLANKPPPPDPTEVVKRGPGRKKKKKHWSQLLSLKKKAEEEEKKGESVETEDNSKSDSKETPKWDSKTDTEDVPKSDTKTNTEDVPKSDTKDKEPPSKIPLLGKKKLKHTPSSSIVTRGAKLPNFGLWHHHHHHHHVTSFHSRRGRPKSKPFGPRKVGRPVGSTKKAMAQLRLKRQLEEPMEEDEYSEPEEKPPKPILLESNPLDWSVEDVVQYLQKTEYAPLAPILKDQEIDGQALLMLNLFSVREYLHLKPEPAEKFCYLIKNLKIEFFTHYFS